MAGVLVGLGLLLMLMKGKGSTSAATDYFNQCKAAITTAVNADVARGSPSVQVNDAWLNQLTMAWVRGDATEIGGIAGGLQITFPFTAQAFGSRFQQITGHPWVPAAAAVAPKAA